MPPVKLKIGDIVRVVGLNSDSLYSEATVGKLFTLAEGYKSRPLAGKYFRLSHYPSGEKLTLDGGLGWPWWGAKFLEPTTKFEARTYEIIHGTENA